MTALVCIEAVAIVLLGVLVAGLLRSHAEILRALHRLGVGLDPAETAGASTSLVLGPRPSDPGGGPPHDPALIAGHESASHHIVGHDIVGVDPWGAAVRVAVVDVRHDTLVAFLSTGCSTCRVFWDSVPRRVVRPGSRPGAPRRRHPRAGSGEPRAAGRPGARRHPRGHVDGGMGGLRHPGGALLRPRRGQQRPGEGRRGGYLVATGRLTPRPGHRRGPAPATAAHGESRPGAGGPGRPGAADRRAPPGRPAPVPLPARRGRPGGGPVTPVAVLVAGIAVAACAAVRSSWSP